MDQVMMMQNIILMFLILLGIFLLIYMIGKRPGKKSGRQIYACGEDISPEKMNIPHESFYKVFVKALKIDSLKKMHTGNLSDYMMWIVIGLLFIVVILSMVW